jgi:hypothetical protein
MGYRLSPSPMAYSRIYFSKNIRRKTTGEARRGHAQGVDSELIAKSQTFYLALYKCLKQTIQRNAGRDARAQFTFRKIS